MNTNAKTRKMTMIAMMCAIAYLMTVLVRVPVVLFLKYDPKDVIITIGGFLFGPMVSFLISAVVSLIEMVTISDTGVIGCIMNFLSTCAFACTAAYIYKKKHSLKGAVMGLLAGCVMMTAVMLLWNYLITPLYMGYPRDKVVELLLPAFLPFNLLKSGLNMAITLLIYKPVAGALRRAGLVAPSKAGEEAGQGKKTGGLLVAGLILITCVLIFLALKGII
ncbi:ECF transporter S component [Anaerolentibacter hominis]|uniref:ECF transporter S component n=1 Tax=Anaerolentibacter hominis TaxID=3079009 RepID=UPI0031B7EF13